MEGFLSVPPKKAGKGLFMQPVSANHEITLATRKPGESVVIRAIAQGRTLRQRLLNLGIVPGETVQIIRGGGRNPMVLEIRGTKVVIGAGMAEKVLVSPQQV
jgi:Fe2+ transport system protein FeoA